MFYKTTLGRKGDIPIEKEFESQNSMVILSNDFESLTEIQSFLKKA